MNEKKLFEIVARVFNVPINEINYESNPENIENWDSFNHILLLDEIEQEFKIEISLIEFSEVKKLSDIKNILEKYGVLF